MNQAEMIARWNEHISYEFSTRDVSSTIATMVEDAYVNHVPVMTGGYGHDAFAQYFIRKTSSHQCRRILRSGSSPARSARINWSTRLSSPSLILKRCPGCCRVFRRLTAMSIFLWLWSSAFAMARLAHERIYWDQASVLKQIGLLTDPSLPVFGAETAHKLLDPAMP